LQFDKWKQTQDIKKITFKIYSLSMGTIGYNYNTSNKRPSDPKLQYWNIACLWLSTNVFLFSFSFGLIFAGWQLFFQNGKKK
jgi:hypothetical protein